VLIENDVAGQGVCEFYAPCLVRGRKGIEPGRLVTLQPQGVENGRIVGVLAGDSA